MIFCFIRDVENYQKKFEDMQQLWVVAKNELEKCSALLIDVSDSPSGGRVAEVGIAYGIGNPIIVVVNKGLSYKSLFGGITAVVIEYEEMDDIVLPLKDFIQACA